LISNSVSLLVQHKGGFVIYSIIGARASQE